MAAEQFRLPAARCCRYCQQTFEPSPYRPQQAICSQPLCQLRRRTEYHRHKIETDTEYAHVVRDSQKKWRAAHPDYQKSYWQNHPGAAERNRKLRWRAICPGWLVAAARCRI